ncbi:zinc-binding dehydrogenase [Jiangella gansuensis]|uniref:zinc-binding dehydrogenase n=1 Tax=Jiangella gansuensis TaxID=281473 RepID=UPI00047C4F8B|nr:zinc-binding dehydrogenase [Jiangella gansuensis]
MRTRAYTVTAPGGGELATVDVDEPGPGQVLLRVLTNGVCASDLPAWANPTGTVPLRLGHEPVGEVVAAGPGVTIAPNTLVGGRIAHSFAELALADVQDVVVVPSGVDPAAALPEPLGCVAEGLRRTPVPIGARVAVVGLGFMGLLMTQFLRNAGVAQLIAIDPREDARHAAMASGADAAHSPAEVPGHAYADDDAPAGHGFDVVVEASGSQPGLDLATRLVRAHGAISILGYHQTTRRVDVRAWNWKALDVVNAHVRDRAMLRASTEAALGLLAAGRIDVGRLVTHRFRFDQIDEAFEALRSKPDGFVKAVVDIG